MGELPSFRIAHSPFFLLSVSLRSLALFGLSLSRALAPSPSPSLSRPYSSQTRFYYYYSSFLPFSFFFLIPQVNHLLPLIFPHLQPIVPLSAITLASSYCPLTTTTTTATNNLLSPPTTPPPPLPRPLSTRPHLLLLPRNAWAPGSRSRRRSRLSPRRARQITSPPSTSSMLPPISFRSDWVA